MAQKTITLSDLSGVEITDDRHARIVIEEHPAIDAPVEIDVTTDEAGQFQTTKLELVHLTVHEPGQPPRHVVLEAKMFAGLFKGVDMAEVIENARPVESSAPVRSGRAKTTVRKPAAPKANRIDYTEMENIGLIHRGRVTDEEAALVRANMGQANANRAREGQPRVGEDPKDAQRYHLD